MWPSARSCSLRWAGYQRGDVRSPLTSIGTSSWAGQVALYTNLIVTGGDMAFTGPISGAGGLGCFSGGTIRLGGSLANTYTGTTLVRCPVLELNKPFGVHAYAGPLVVGTTSAGRDEVRWLNFYQNPSTPLTLYANGVVNLGWSKSSKTSARLDSTAAPSRPAPGFSSLTTRSPPTRLPPRRS